jgi:NADP-dependent 3-hydroxy acid dehydrogenase YdfG
MTTSHPFSLKDQIVLITGATSGIGEACAAHFAAQKSKILICGRRVERLKSLAQALKKDFKVDAHYFTLDVTDKAAVEKTLQNLPAEWLDISVLVNNAGLAKGFEKLQEGKTEDWEMMIDTNIKGLLYVTRQILPGMIQRNKGHVINIGSIVGHEVYSKGAVYASTKHAVNAISRSLRLDLLGTMVRVSEVNPGMVETEFSLVRFSGDSKQAKTVYQGMTPLTADDVADAVVYCASRPPHVNINELIIVPTDQAGVTTVNRRE